MFNSLKSVMKNSVIYNGSRGVRFAGSEQVLDVYKNHALHYEEINKQQKELVTKYDSIFDGIKKRQDINYESKILLLVTLLSAIDYKATIATQKAKEKIIFTLKQWGLADDDITDLVKKERKRIIQEMTSLKSAEKFLKELKEPFTKFLISKPNKQQIMERIQQIISFSESMKVTLDTDYEEIKTVIDDFIIKGTNAIFIRNPNKEEKAFIMKHYPALYN